MGVGVRVMVEDTSIFQEIDEALRIDNVEKFLRKYGRLVIAACVAIVLVTAASAIWRNHRHDVNVRQTSVVLQIQDLIDANKYPEAQKKIEDLIAKGQTLPALAKLQYTEVLIKSGNFEKAKTVYEEIASDKGNDAALRDLAMLNANIIESNINPSAVIKDGTGKERPFASIADELKAVELHKHGKDKEARKLLENVAANPALSMEEHHRAMELLDNMGEDKK